MADEIIVYELKLEQDGSPSKEKKVSVLIGSVEIAMAN
jgi:hypothetical protein